MADIDDLNYKSILDMDNDEGQERLRQIRLSRRTPTRKTGSRKVKQAADVNITDPEMARRLLKMLGGEDEDN